MRGLRLGLGLGLSRSAGFSPLALFTANEQGFIYDPSDFTTLYQDNAGTTPVTAVGQTVGLVLDKSKGLVLGPELAVNGDFSNGTTGWNIGSGSLTVVSGRGRLENISAAAAYAVLTVPTVAGRAYRLNMEAFAGTTTGNYRVGTTSNGSELITTVSVSGNAPRIFVATTTTTYVTIRTASAVSGEFCEFDNISVRELPGNHATQSVLASRPILAREPLGGRRNLLTWTEQFDNAAWVKGGVSVSANDAIAPDGTTTADLLTGTGATPRVYQTATLVNGQAYTATAYIKPGTTTSIGFDVINIQAGPVFTFATKTWSAFAGQITAASYDELAGGWFRLRITFTANTTNAGPGFYVSGLTTAHIWGAQLETGSTATAYQRVTSVYDVTEAGKADLHYLLFDGSDDFLVTSTITPGTDKAQVFAGVRKLSDAAAGMLLELSASVGGNNGALYVIAPYNPGPNYGFGSKGTTATEARASGFTAPITSIVTGIGEIVTDTNKIRVNGIAGTPATADQGTGNYLAYPAYIGRRGGTTLPFNGRLYGLIARFGPNLSEVQIAQTEQWLNGKTGAY